MHVHIHISTLVDESLVVYRVERLYLFSLVGFDTWVKLIILWMVDFYIILVWLSLYHVILDCNAYILTYQC